MHLTTKPSTIEEKRNYLAKLIPFMKTQADRELAESQLRDEKHVKRLWIGYGEPLWDVKQSIVRNPYGRK